MSRSHFSVAMNFGVTVVRQTISWVGFTNISVNKLNDLLGGNAAFKAYSYIQISQKFK
jgi:hypothetical protein